MRLKLTMPNPSSRPLQDHRHAFVRKNAVFTVYSIYKLHEHLIPDAPELLLTFLAAVSLVLLFASCALGAALVELRLTRSDVCRAS